MADIRKVTVSPPDSEDYVSWVNFDRVLYVEECGEDDEGIHYGIMVMKGGKDIESFRVRIEQSWKKPNH